MKKLLLLTLSILIVGYAGAQTTMKDYMKAKHLAFQPLNKKAPLFTGAETLTIPDNFDSQIRTDGAAFGSIVIGTTVYDLQTNAAVARRIYLHDNGAITAVWTTAQLTNFNDRGTGYAYSDGNSWTVTNPQVSLEPIKTGWPTIDILNGKEVDISHDGNNYQMQQGVSSGIGLGTPSDWTFNVSGASVPVENSGNVHGPIWPRMIVNGNSIHVVSAFQITDSANIVNGVKAPFVYSRSTDGGATWTSNIGLPLYDSTRTLYGSGDEYDIDYNDGVLSIVHGGLGEDVTMWKSTDDGATWVHNYVDSFEYAPDYASQAPVNLVLPTNDGSVSTVVDDNGQIHVAYAESNVLNDPTIGAAFQPGTIGLRYWTEGMDTAFSIPLPISAFDVDGDGNYVIGSNTAESGNPGPPVGCRYRNSSVLTHPSITYDNLGDIFIVFSMPRDLDTTFDGLTYRDVYIAAHKAEDDISLWTISNVTNTEFTEEAFGNAARRSDDKVRIEYMEDSDPGTNLNNLHPITTNNINYIEWQNPFITGIDPISTATNFSVKQNYPNPFADQTMFEISMKISAQVTMKVTNLLGEVVLNNSYKLPTGISTIAFNRNQLSSGVYYSTITVGNESLTRKMVID